MTLMERRRGLMGGKKGGVRLPAEYQEVEWICGGSTQYVNSGITGPCYVGARIIYLDTGVTQRALFGMELSASPWNTACVRTKDTLDYYDFSGSRAVGTSAPSNDEHYIEAIFSTSKKYFAVDNAVIINGTVSATATNLPLFILALNGGGVAKQFSKSKLIELIIMDENKENILLHIIPCYRKADGVIGVYDIVSNSFLPNAGSGSFTKGADV